MQPPPYTFDKPRIDALDAYDILDTPPETGFDDIVQLATQICDAPVALVSLVTVDRQWFKARIGFEPCETDINSSVCAFALVEPDLLVIPDLTLDVRTRTNPLVVRAPHIRFYAGAPLRAPSGHIVGSLCVIDGKPRPEGLTEIQAGGLRSLARQVVSQLELRRAVSERDQAMARQRALEVHRKQTEEQFRLLFESIDDGFCVVEVKFEGLLPIDYRFLDANPAFARQTGLADAKGRWMRDLAPNHEQHWFDLYGGVAMTGEAVRFELPANELGGRWYDVRAFRVGAPEARRVGILFADVTQKRRAEIVRQEAEEQQELLNRELSHRMKNMFAMIQAIATQTLRMVTDQEPVNAFIQRLHALSQAHDVLLQQSWAAAKIGEVVRAALAALTDLTRFDLKGPVVEMGPRATLSVSLLLHELTTNALKHGALSVEGGRVGVEWRVGADSEGAEQLVLSWRESGGPEALAPKRKGFGSRLIQMGLVGTGGVDLRYHSLGLEAEFKAPLAQVQLT